MLPLSFAVFGFSFPVGVLLYWLTTNIWSMGQQRYVIARMPPVVPGSGGVATKDGKETKDDKPGRRSLRGSAPEEPPAEPEAPSKPATPPPPARPAAKGQSGSRKNKKRKGGRR